MNIQMNSTTFLKLGNRFTKSNSSRSDKTKLRRFQSFFGVTPEVCVLIWLKIKDSAPCDAQPKHLLWCLLFLKQNSIEHVRRSIVDADEKTIRKWTWLFTKLLSDLNMIIWEKRFDAAVQNQTCFVSLDGVDFKILEPTPFSAKWCSHKFHSAGLRYEVGLNIRTGNIVWTNGGYPCGDIADITLARQAYIFLVNQGERTMADKGYKDKRYFILPNPNNKTIHQRIMSRHETINKRFKQFQILKKPFRYELKKHPMVFRAVGNLVQLMLENGEPLFKAI